VVEVSIGISHGERHAAEGQALEEEAARRCSKNFSAANQLRNRSRKACSGTASSLRTCSWGQAPPALHNQVQEICGDSIQRYQSYYWERANQGQAINNVEMANLREHTRTELRKVLNPIEVEEFVLRYSHNAHQLREELRGSIPAPEEFRQSISRHRSARSPECNWNLAELKP